MKLICWNCQGIGGDLTVDVLMEQNRLHTPDIMILLETKNRSHRYVFFKRRLGMDFMHAIEPRGIAGGMCIFWRNYDHVLLVKYADFFVEVGISDVVQNEQWRLFASYASTDAHKRKEQWRLLSQRFATAGDKCLLIGDFNDITDDSEKEKGNYLTITSQRIFCDFIIDNGLLELGFPFTWINRRDEDPIQECLDGGLATSGWVNMYQEAKVLHEVLEGSDHTMLILETNPSLVPRKKRFIYDSRWNKVEACHGIVKGTWCRGFVGSHAFRVTEKLKWVRHGLLEWRQTSGSNSKHRIVTLKEELQHAYKSPIFANNEVWCKEVELKCMLRDERYWRVKSRTQWIKEGDKNTKFFHAQAVKRRRCNKIVGLEDDREVWCTEPSQVDTIAVGSF